MHPPSAPHPPPTAPSATVGEITAALERVWGRYEAGGGLAAGSYGGEMGSAAAAEVAAVERAVARFEQARWGGGGEGVAWPRQPQPPVPASMGGGGQPRRLLILGGRGAGSAAPPPSLTCTAPPPPLQAAGRRPRILVAKMGMDGHDRGAKVMATG